MTDEELVIVMKIFPHAKGKDPMECVQCRWKGTLLDLHIVYVVSDRPRILTCPDCGYGLIHTAPHVW